MCPQVTKHLSYCMPGLQTRRYGSPWHGQPRSGHGIIFMVVPWSLSRFQHVLRCLNMFSNILKCVDCFCLNSNDLHWHLTLCSFHLVHTCGKAWFRRAMVFEKMRDYRNAVLDLEEADASFTRLRDVREIWYCGKIVIQQVPVLGTCFILCFDAVSTLDMLLQITPVSCRCSYRLDG